MRVISPGVVAVKPIVIEINSFTEEMVEWYQTQGAVVERRENSYSQLALMRNGQPVTNAKPFVRLNGAKANYYYSSGDRVRLFFNEEDASTASIFLLKFDTSVLTHNLEIPEWAR